MREYSVGRGAEIDKAADTFSVEKVKNKLLLVNPNVQAPFEFDLEKLGQASSLGLFFTPKPGYRYGLKEEKPSKKIPKNKARKSSLAEVNYRHGRSAIIGRVMFKGESVDADGNIMIQFYRDVDVKGLGYLNWYSYKPDLDMVSPHSAYPGDMWGLLDKQTALKCNRIAEEFLKKGIRTERTLALIELDEIIDPVVAVRAFGTRGRVSDRTGDLSGAKAWGRQFLLYDDARQLVAAENNKPADKYSFFEYYEWFAKTLGENVGRMHRGGWYHGSLPSGPPSPCNVTLDCRILDLDTVRELPKGAKHSKAFTKKDFDDSKYIIQEFYKDFLVNLNHLLSPRFRTDENPPAIDPQVPNWRAVWDDIRAISDKGEGYFLAIFKEAYNCCCY